MILNDDLEGTWDNCQLQGTVLALALLGLFNDNLSTVSLYSIKQQNDC
jgi:hypothetical protein